MGLRNGDWGLGTRISDLDLTLELGFGIRTWGWVFGLVLGWVLGFGMGSGSEIEDWGLGI